MIVDGICVQNHNCCTSIRIGHKSRRRVRPLWTHRKPCWKSREPVWTVSARAGGAAAARVSLHCLRGRSGLLKHYFGDARQQNQNHGNAASAKLDDAAEPIDVAAMLCGREATKRSKREQQRQPELQLRLHWTLDPFVPTPSASTRTVFNVSLHVGALCVLLSCTGSP